MSSRLNSVAQGLLRGLTRLAQLIALAFVTGSAAILVAAYATAAGADPRLLHAIVTALGKPFAGQRTEHVDATVQVYPESHRLAAQTTLRLRSDEDARQRFLFLLNPALQLSAVRMFDDRGTRAASVLRFGALVVVEPAEPLARDEVTQVRFDYEGQFTADPPDPIPSVIDSRQIQLGPEAFWYPIDAQSYFSAEVRFTLPREMVVAHNDPHATRSERGVMQTVHWRSPRLTASIPLVAGSFRRFERVADDTHYQLYLDEDIDLDSASILDHMATANRFLRTLLGTAELDAVSVYVTRSLRRGVNYGNGLIGLSIRYFRGGDGGFALLAHEIAHNWWGGSVAERWLNPGTGGQWLVEGLAELCSLLATENRFGSDALTRRLAANFFDPARQRAIRNMSMLDNVINESNSRDTIYRKGSLVAYRLCASIGYESCFAALRLFVERHRYQQATDSDLQAVFEEVVGHELGEWFEDWIGSDRLADLELVMGDDQQLELRNRGTARAGEGVPLWVLPADDSEPTQSTARVGDRLRLQTGDTAIVDPQLQVPDVQRANNRYPSEKQPLYVAVAGDGRLALTRGEAFPWSPQTILMIDGATTLQTWDLEHGTLQPPEWFPDGKQLLVSYAHADRPLPLILTLASDGTRRTLGRGTAPRVAVDGSVYAGRGDSILRITSDGKATTLIRHRGYVLDQPLPSPDGRQIAYLAGRRNRLEIRLANTAGNEDRTFLVVDRDRTLLRWGRASDHIYALVGGNDDWQIWELPLDGAKPRVLVRDAFAIGDFSLSPDGTQLALTAAPERNYPELRRRLYVVDLASAAVRPVDVPEMDLGTLAWVGDDTILVSGARTSSSRPWILPQSRTLHSISLSDLSVRALP